jgi:hypothetical protein
MRPEHIQALRAKAQLLGEGLVPDVLQAQQ